MSTVASAKLFAIVLSFIEKETSLFSILYAGLSKTYLVPSAFRQINSERWFSALPLPTLGII
jgi:hypothetical protein